MSNNGDFGTHDLDPDEQRAAEINLDDPSAGDDEPWSPPERQPRGPELIGVDTDGGESLSQRLGQEEPELAEEVEGGADMLGGDDPDAIPAEVDVLGGDHDEQRAGLPAEDGPEPAAVRVEGDDPTP